MADDRPANDDLTAVVADLKRELDDLRSTTLARISRSATGTVEMTIRTTPKADTLFMQGQTLARSDYPVLWQWVVDQELAPSVFGSGDGATTFVLPDLRGRTVVGASAARAVGTKFGAQTTTLALANMPAHDHGDTGLTSQQHTHPFTTSSESTNHSHSFGTGVESIGHEHASHGHSSAIPRSDGGSTNVGPVLTSSQVAGPNRAHTHGGRTDVTVFSHDHTGNTGAGALTTHSHTIASQGSGTAVNTEDPGIAVNWLIYI